MIAALALAGALTTSPFADDLSISIEGYDGTIVNNVGYNPKTLTWPIFAATYNAAAPVDALPPVNFDEGSTPCSGVSCTIPSYNDIPDWTSVYELRYGIQIEGVEEFTWPTGEPPAWIYIVNHLKDFQTIHAVALRDAGVSLKIQHIHIIWPRQPIDDHGATAAKWQHDITPSRPVHRVLRLGNKLDGLATLDLTCTTGVTVARAPYYLDTDPASPDRNYNLHFAAHELFHMVLGLAHTQCYRDANGDPIERCDEVACYRGALACPTAAAQSFMGYCVGCNANTSLRVGPPGGAMNVIARWNALVFANDCLEPAVASLPANMRAANRDGDEYPDAIDNCPNVANDDQLDTNLNGRGDACDGCAVGSTNASAWPLVLPLMLLWRRRGHAVH